MTECEQCGKELNDDQIYECCDCSAWLCESCIDGQNKCNDCL